MSYTAFELASKFAKSPYSENLCVSTGLQDFDRDVVYPNGRWGLLGPRQSNGNRSVSDITPLEVKAEILAYIRDCTAAEISGSLISEVEQLSKILILERGDSK